jgi:hypothetical protein
MAAPPLVSSPEGHTRATVSMPVSGDRRIAMDRGTLPRAPKARQTVAAAVADREIAVAAAWALPLRIVNRHGIRP